MRKEKTNMELKDYREQPDEGLFEQIQHRLRVRRMWRMGGGVAVVLVAVAVVIAVAMPRGGEDSVERRVESGKWKVERDATVAAAAPVAEQTATVKKDMPRQELAVQPHTAAPVAEPAEVAQPEVAQTAVPQVVAPVKVASSQRPVETAPVAEVQVAAVAPAVDSSHQAPAEKPLANPAAKNDPNPVTPVHYDNIVWAPNVIVPNGDVDENRTFSFKYSSEITNFRIFIYNRGGRRVFSSSNPEFAWDGTADGTALPQGAYVWVARFRDSDGRQREEKGSVTILR